ncbi:MAG TPA: hypothetical protein DCG53_07530 [Syntrophus sp. (in: bacteria)]|nr:hypothetical protein [Syntrophus sp. (in: bacteria)]
MKTLIRRVEALKLLLVPKTIDWGRIHDCLREMDAATAPGPPEWTAEQWEENFIERHGTREEFIKGKERRHEIHRRA